MKARHIVDPRCHGIDGNGTTSRWFLGAALLVAALSGNGTAAAAVPEQCDMQLVVELTPDVPDPRDPAFLGSLLSNESGYLLTFVREVGDSSIVVELSGPGPEDRCQEVLEVIRKDGRVLSVQPQQPQ